MGEDDIVEVIKGDGKHLRVLKERTGVAGIEEDPLSIHLEMNREPLLCSEEPVGIPVLSMRMVNLTVSPPPCQTAGGFTCWSLIGLSTPCGRLIYLELVMGRFSRHGPISKGYPSW